MVKIATEIRYAVSVDLPMGALELERKQATITFVRLVVVPIKLNIGRSVDHNFLWNPKVHCYVNKRQ
jgi:hypothetical protein